MNLSTEQHFALNEFIKGKNLFLTGPAGTGKSYLIENFINYCNNNNINCQVTALTGVASVLLKNARTLHSWAGIRLAKGPKNEIINYVIKNKKAVANWRKIQVLIIDEVSMMSLKIFELLEELARVIRRTSIIFGGIQVVFTGDMFQLSPVGSSLEPETSMFCFESIIWNKIFSPENHIELKTIFRQTDPLFTEILQQIRVGKIDEKNIEILNKCLKREYKPEDHDGIVLTKLFAVKNKVDFVNTSMYNKIQEPEICFDIKIKTDCLTYLDSGVSLSYETLIKCKVITEKEKEYEIESLINNTNCSRLTSLKKGATVMCTFNLDTDLGICNGSQGVISDFVSLKNGESIPIVKFANGIIMPIDIHYYQSDDYPIIAIGQIPLILCYALTIHKIQGSTLDMAEMDIGNTIFEYGQTYVALSRVKSLEGLYLNAFNPNKIKANKKVIDFYNKIPPLNIINNSVNSLDFSAFEYKEEEIKEDKNIKIIKNVGTTNNNNLYNVIKTDNLSYNDFECCICMENISEKKNNCITPCGHKFCFVCISTNLKKSNLCPICREKI
jgi:ATP-dependent DNA helicase PIF1